MKEVKSPRKPLIYYYGIVLLVILVFNMVISPLLANARVKEVDYGTFMKMIEDKDIGSVEVADSEIVFTDKDNTQIYKTGEMNDPTLTERLYASGAKFTRNIEKGMSPLLSFFLTFILPILIFAALGQYMAKKMMSQAGGPNAMAFGMGKSNAKVYVPSTDGIRFADVAGEDEAKENLAEIVDYLHNPKKYSDVGASMPKGVLLVGPPGTGKTMLAKAVAGEAGVPFFSMSGSEFVEMFVGMGASKVRDLFKQAKEKAPCIVFIDEIDAIGKKRDGQIGGNDEREQTLNQLLTEMDGFEGNNGVIILAATNRPESLDPALTRPGRFDRRVPVELPDLKGREEILKVHAKNVKMDETVDFREVALATSGAVGADLANMINEAAILAVRNHRKAVSQKDLLDSVEVVLVGKEKKSRVLSKEERKIVSYHEVGHALVSAIQKHSEPVQKITIVPRTMGALGYVMNVPEEEKYLNSEEEIRAMLVEFTAGRVAEELVFGSITTGASNDIEKATRIARAMVTQYGMSKRFGFVQLESQTSQYLDDGRRVMNCSEQTAAEVDEEVMAIMKQSYEQARKILTEHRKALDQIAAFLIEKETITGKEFMDILEKVDQPDHTEGTESTETPQA